MALTMDMATDEKLLREALGAKLLDIAAPFGFVDAHVQTRKRFVRTPEQWEAIALVPAADDASQKMLRLLTVTTAGSVRVTKEWRITWAVSVGYGFEDERVDGSNSTDDLMRLVYTIMQQVFEDPALGVDEQITVTSVRHLPSRDGGFRFVPQDVSGRPSQVADITIEATLEVC